jgi:hypothetical protein
MVHYDHRYSYDIDAFVGSGDVIRVLSPNRNPATKALLKGRKYDYPGNHLKLVLDSGEIDFIVGGARTDRAIETWNFEGRAVPIDMPLGNGCQENVLSALFLQGPGRFRSGGRGRTAPE